MGSKPSGVKGGTVVAKTVGGSDNICHVPKQDQTASAPPTPQRPDGAPRPTSAGNDPFPPPNSEAANGQEAPESPESAAPAHQPVRVPDKHATHSGASGGFGASTSQGGQTAAAATTAAVGSSAPATGVQAAPGGAPPCWVPRTAAGQGEDGLAGGALRFDAATEEVLAQATEAFGSIVTALSSPKWDRRVQALKGVATVLKGLDLKAERAPPPQSRESCRGLKLRDGATCFRAACLILNIVLRDKVLPVLFAAHDLYRVTFEHGETLVPREEASFAMATLMQHVLSKLGEINIRLHESACSALVFSTGRPPRLGLVDLFGRLSKHIAECPLRGQQRMRVHAGVLDVVGQLLRRFPGRHSEEGDESDGATSWSAADVAPFVFSGVQVDAVTGTRVRQAAAGLAVVVYTTLGKRSLDEVVEMLPEAGKDLVMQKIEEETGETAEDRDCEDMDDEAGGGEELPPGASLSLDLCVQGVAIRPPPELRPAALCKTDGKEENFMDEILEETGMVFQGEGLRGSAVKEDHLGGNSGLDEDLRNLGLLDGPNVLA